MLEGLAKVAVEKDIIVLSDEIYDKLIYSGHTFRSFASFGEEVKNARQNWRFDLEARENLDHKGSALLVLRNLSRAV